MKFTQHTLRNNLQPSLVPTAILILMGLLVSIGATPPNQTTLQYSEISGWRIKTGTVEGGVYRLQTSPSLSDSWQWIGAEMIASKAESEFPVVVSPDTDPRRFWRVARLIHKIAFVGDSITDSTSGYPNQGAPVGIPSYMHRSYSGYAAAILGHAFTPTTNSYSFLGPAQPDWDFGWGGIRADGYLTATVNSRSSGGNQYPGVTLTPAQAA